MYIGYRMPYDFIVCCKCVCAGLFLSGHKMGLDYDCFLSQFARNCSEPPLREMHTIIQKSPKDLISLTLGNPNTACFPLDGITLHLKNGTDVRLTESDAVKAQQYGATQGSVAYQSLLKNLVHTLHNPPCWEKSPDEGKTVVLPTCGATDGINQALKLLADPGDKILVEEFTFPAAISMSKGLRLDPVPVAIDADGLIPEALDKIMSKWDPDAKPGSTDKPKVLYIIPTGQNPCGSALTLDRKRKIYQIAHKYNLLILEDDPYHLINFQQKQPTFLSMDTDGRVFRVDSFSKSIAPGLRAGYISGPYPLMDKARKAIGASTLGTACLSQSVILALFKESGIDGFISKAQGIADFYRKQRDILLSSANRWLLGLVEYSVPTSGLYLWVKIIGCNDTKTMLYEKALAKGVMATPGEYYQPLPGKPSSFIRISFSGPSEDIEKGVQILADVIKDINHS